jgi:alkylation response protein AidB-like acyl-CoA dehydrogenase
MQFDLTDEQRELRDTARRFLEREAPVAYARAMMDDPRGYRDDVWRKMADLGWMGLPFPEEHGGLGLGVVELAILLAEMGRVVLPGPYLSTVLLAGSALLLCGTEEQRKELLPRICGGELVATLAFGRPERPDKEGLTLEARGSALTGSASFVPDAAASEIVVVAARTPGLFAVRTDAPGVRIDPVSIMDMTRKVAEVKLEGAPAEPLAEDGWAPIQRVLDRAAVGLAAEALGGAERVLEVSVDYAKQRVQFDRPIGSFQAVKHRLADMLLDVESLRSAVYYAAWAVDRDHPDASLAASMAKAYASDAYRRVSASGIQVHGGIGFTWEHDMHLFFKRAKHDEVAFGDAVWHRERIAQILKRRYAPAPA